MPNEQRQYYVFREDNCKFESMTKEQIITAIANATGVSPEAVDVDDAFISKIQEMNQNNNLKWWVGTEAEYNAIEDLDAETLYIITDAADDTGAVITALKEQLDDLQERINETVKPSIQNAVVITDSYGDEELTGTTSLTNLIARLQQHGVEISQYAVKPGAGFNASTGQYSFGTALGSMDNDDKVTEVVVIGGYNDVNNGTYETIAENAARFCIAAAYKFPNAKVRAYFVGKQAYNMQGGWRINYYKALQAWQEGFRNSVAEVVEGSPFILTSADMFVSDLFHPNEVGVERLAKHIATSIKTGSPVSVEDTKECVIDKAAAVTNLDTGVTHEGLPVCYEYVSGAVSRIWLKKLHVDFNNVNVTMDGTPVAIGSLINPILNGSQYGDFKAVVPCGAYVAGQFINASATLAYAGNTLTLAMYAINSAGTGKVSGTMTAFESLMPIALECPTIHVMN